MKKRYLTILRITNSSRDSQSPVRMLALILCLASTGVYAQGTSDRVANQNTYIVNAVVYNKGVYKTFDEFKHNKPSITDHYVIEKGKIWKTYESGPKKKIKKNAIWGHCTGDKIFVRTAMYNQIRELGRYCYFRDQGKSQLYGDNTHNMANFTPYKERMIIDFNTGKIERLTTRSMKRILETDDPELFAEFTAEPSNGKDLYEYLMKYNQRNKGKIK